MTVIIWHNPACGTSRNTLGLIRNCGEEPRIVDYLHTPPNRDELAAAIQAAGLSVREALRRKGTPYDGLGLDDSALSDDALLNAMLFTLEVHRATRTFWDAAISIDCSLSWSLSEQKYLLSERYCC